MPKMKQRKPPKEGVCEWCKSTDKVEFRPDPYRAELENDLTKHWICDPCFYKMQEEI